MIIVGMEVSDKGIETINVFEPLHESPKSLLVEAQKKER